MVQDSATTGAIGDFCSPMSLVGNLCVDMPRMKGCEAYVALCDTRGSQVGAHTRMQPSACAQACVRACAENALLGVVRLRGSSSARP